MSEPRILIVGAGASVSATLIAALATVARVQVLGLEAPVEPGLVDRCAPLACPEEFLMAEPRELRQPHPGYGPPRRGKRGKVLRW